jgi:hypothetical protein
MRTKTTLFGLLSLSLLTLNGCSTAPIKTETVTVYVPQTVKVPKELADPVPVPDKEIVVNSDLADYIVMLKSALAEANRKLEAIGDLE